MKRLRVYLLLIVSLLLLVATLYGLLVGPGMGEPGPAHTLSDSLPETWGAARDTVLHAWEHRLRP